ncbi:MAG TPA: hypothetical protein VEA18_03300 [Candidatus Kapabacteria bacterium]|nr:hypothetical protein [Candidatus Kapabacteria bacterium]
MTTIRIGTMAAIFVAALSLTTACGGGNSGDSDPTIPSPTDVVTPTDTPVETPTPTVEDPTMDPITGLEATRDHSRVTLQWDRGDATLYEIVRHNGHVEVLGTTATTTFVDDLSSHPELMAENLGYTVTPIDAQGNRGPSSEMVMTQPAVNQFDWMNDTFWCLTPIANAWFENECHVTSSNKIFCDRLIPEEGLSLSHEDLEIHPENKMFLYHRKELECWIEHP